MANLITTALNSLSRFRPNEIFNAGADILEAGIRTSKNHSKLTVLGFSALNMGITAGMSRKGHLASNIAGAGAGELGALIGSGIGALIPIPGAALLGSIIGYNVGFSTVGKAVYNATQLAKKANHLNVGGDYHDTEIAFTMRQRASMELSGSLLNARKYLGSEARLQHS